MMYYIENEEGAVDTSEVEKDLDALLAYLDEDGDFSIHFITDEEMRNLNNSFRGKDEPTDILSFAINDGDEFPSMEGEEREIGDIFISVESMKRNAESFSVSAGEELKRLLVHGLLHLRGMDHSSNDFSSEPMLIEQERIMKALEWA